MMYCDHENGKSTVPSMILVTWPPARSMCDEVVLGFCKEALLIKFRVSKLFKQLVCEFSVADSMLAPTSMLHLPLFEFTQWV